MRYFLIILVCYTTKVAAQPGFQFLYGGSDHERAQNVIPFAGGYIINGTTKSFGAGYYDACLIRTNGSGNVVWGKTYGSAGFDNSECAIKTFDNNIICAGRTEILAGAATTAIIFKTDSSGNMQWGHTYGVNQNSSFGQVIETMDHGYAATGYIENAGQKNIFFVRTDINGDTIFSKTYSSPQTQVGISVLQSFDSTFYIAGRIVNAGLSDAFLMHTDASGSMLWMKRYGAIRWDEFNCIKMTGDSLIVIAGATTSSGQGTYDILLAKSDLNGNIQWCATYGGIHTDAAYDLRILNSGYVLGGYTETYMPYLMGDDSTNMFLMKTDVDGNFLWMQVYGDGLQDEGFHCELDDDGGFLVPGFTLSYIFTDSTQMMVIKTDSNGVSGCHEKSAVPVSGVYSITEINDTFVVQPVTSFDSLFISQNNANITSDDACLFAEASQPELKTLQMYPVPVNDYLIFNADDNSLIQIYSSNGALVDSYNMAAGKMRIDVRKFSPGYYFITQVAAKQIRTGKFIIAR